MGGVPFPLRPYQAEAVKGCVAAAADGLDPAVSLPTGTGKTAVKAAAARELAERLGGRVFFTVHRTELADQITRWLARVDPAHPASREQAHRRGNRGWHKARYVVSLVQTTGSEAAGRTRLSEYDPKEFVAHVTDEAHHATAPGYRRTMEHFRQHKGCRFLGFSATWFDGDGTAKGARCGYNAVAYRMSIREAMAEAWLVPVAVSGVEVRGVDWGAVAVDGDGRYTDDALDDVLSREEPLHKLAVPIVERCGDRPTLFFGVRHRQTEALASVIDRYRPGQVRTAYGEPRTAAADRAAFFADFGRLFQFGGTVGVATEGVDVPRAAAAAICRPCQSDVLATQIVGRVLRPQDGLLDAEAARDRLWHDRAARAAAIAASGKPNALVLDFVSLGARKLVTAWDVLGQDRPAAVREYAARIAGQAAAGEAQDAEAVLERAEDEWALIQEEVQRRRGLTARAVRYQTTEVDLFDARAQAEPERVPTVDQFVPPTDNQVWTLVNRVGMSEGFARTRSRHAASAIIAKWKAKQGAK